MIITYCLRLLLFIVDAVLAEARLFSVISRVITSDNFASSSINVNFTVVSSIHFSISWYLVRSKVSKAGQLANLQSVISGDQLSREYVSCNCVKENSIWKEDN